MLLPVAAVAVAAGGTVLIKSMSERDVPPASEARVVPLDELDVADGYVRVKGMAHYQSVITQKVPSNLLHDEATWYVYGFFPVHDSDNRAVRVLVRSQRKPEALVSYEVMEVEGWVGPPVPNKIPPSTETMLSNRSEYYFSDDMLLLEATRIYSEDGVWETP
jgi:hypothetical protein